MQRSLHRALLTAGFGLALAAALEPAGATTETGQVQGLVVRRKVAGDEPIVRPVREGQEQPQTPARRCPSKIERAPLGAEVADWLAPQMARRDEPGWSLILRLDEARAYLLYHRDRRFSVLRYPPEPQELRVSSYRDPHYEEWAKTLPPTRPETPPRATARTVGGQQVTEHGVTLIGSFGHRTDVMGQMLPHPSLGEVAFRLEALVQALWGQGREWLSFLEAGHGVLVGAMTASPLPDGKLVRREDFVTLEAQAIQAEHFAVPPGYEKLPYSADCLLMP